VKSEEDPLDPAPVREMRETLAAIRHLEEAVLDARWTQGIVLRYGAFYGPGTSLASGEEQFELVRRRKFPLVGDGGGVWSFIHVADAAEATVAAVEHGGHGVYNVGDDDPAPVAEWLPALAQTLGAKKPMRVPRFVGRLFAGEPGVVMMTEIRGASNAKAKRELRGARRIRAGGRASRRRARSRAAASHAAAGRGLSDVGHRHACAARTPRSTRSPTTRSTLVRPVQAPARSAGGFISLWDIGGAWGTMT
jgi:NAD dependent epimerase/dehydratase family